MLLKFLRAFTKELNCIQLNQKIPRLKETGEVEVKTKANMIENELNKAN
jgi:hypothetical protein